MLQAELVELLRGLEGALSLHVQLEAPPHETGDAAPMDFDPPSSSGSAAFSHLKTSAERVALVRHPHPYIQMEGIFYPFRIQF